MTLDTSKMLIVKTEENGYHFVDHGQRLMTMGVMKKKTLQKYYSDAFADSEQARKVMRLRYEAWVVKQVVDLMRPFQQHENQEVDSDKDADVRRLLRAALRNLDVYDAGGCPLCLS